MFRNPIVDALVVLVIVLLFFGPKRLPELGRSLGSGLRGFKDEITSDSDSDAERPELTRASDDTGTAAPPQAGTGASQAGAERRP
jgi:sec-independent protein translocase protein TatA